MRNFEALKKIELGSLHGARSTSSHRCRCRNHCSGWLEFAAGLSAAQITALAKFAVSFALSIKLTADAFVVLDSAGLTRLLVEGCFVAIVVSRIRLAVCQYRQKW